MLEKVCPMFENVKLGDTVKAADFESLLRDGTIWGVDLYSVDMADLVIEYFNKLIAGKGAIRKTVAEMRQM